MEKGKLFVKLYDFNNGWIVGNVVSVETDATGETTIVVETDEVNFKLYSIMAFYGKYLFMVRRLALAVRKGDKLTVTIISSFPFNEY